MAVFLWTAKLNMAAYGLHLVSMNHNVRDCLEAILSRRVLGQQRGDMEKLKQ